MRLISPQRSQRRGLFSFIAGERPAMKKHLAFGR
jgi:hypothetical protein